MIELHNQFGVIDLTKVSPDEISELSPAGQQALSVLIDSVKARETAEDRKIAATKRVAMATAAEAQAAQDHADASLPIPFTTAKMEEQLGRKLTDAELKDARAAHDLRCRQLLEHKARRVASGTSDDDGVAVLGDDGKWANAAPEKKTGHAKHAIKGPKVALEKAQAEMSDATLELHAAMDQARRTSLIEADALSNFQSLQRRPTQDELLRQSVKHSLEQRAANVAAGLPPGGIKKPTHGSSPIDILASQRPRGSGPLRSPVVRRTV